MVKHYQNNARNQTCVSVHPSRSLMRKQHIQQVRNRAYKLYGFLTAYCCFYLNLGIFGYTTNRRSPRLLLLYFLLQKWTYFSIYKIYRCFCLFLHKNTYHNSLIPQLHELLRYFRYHTINTIHMSQEYGKFVTKANAFKKMLIFVSLQPFYLSNFATLNIRIVKIPVIAEIQP